jgi:hypothetical protein
MRMVGEVGQGGRPVARGLVLVTLLTGGGAGMRAEGCSGRGRRRVAWRQRRPTCRRWCRVGRRPPVVTTDDGGVEGTDDPVNRGRLRPRPAWGSPEATIGNGAERRSALAWGATGGAEGGGDSSRVRCNENFHNYRFVTTLLGVRGGHREGIGRGYEFFKFIGSHYTFVG